MIQNQEKLYGTPIIVNEAFLERLHNAFCRTSNIYLDEISKYYGFTRDELDKIIQGNDKNTDDNNKYNALYTSKSVLQLRYEVNWKNGVKSSDLKYQDMIDLLKFESSKPVCIKVDMGRITERHARLEIGKPYSDDIKLNIGSDHERRTYIVDIFDNVMNQSTPNWEILHKRYFSYIVSIIFYVILLSYIIYSSRWIDQNASAIYSTTMSILSGFAALILNRVYKFSFPFIDFHFGKKSVSKEIRTLIVF